MYVNSINTSFFTICYNKDAVLLLLLVVQMHMLTCQDNKTTVYVKKGIFIHSTAQKIQRSNFTSLETFEAVVYSRVP